MLKWDNIAIAMDRYAHNHINIKLVLNDSIGTLYLGIDVHSFQTHL